MFLSRSVISRTLLFTERCLIPTRKCSQTVINLSDPVVQKYLQNIMIEYDMLHTKTKRTLQDSRRLTAIKPLVSVLDQRICLFDNIHSLKELTKKDSKDEDMQKMIQEEAKIYLKMLKEVDEDLLSVLLDPRLTNGGILLEVSAGVGGQEAMLFAKELFEMYERYGRSRNWQVDVAAFEFTEMGGIRKGSLLMSGDGVPELMKMEAGVHRVQRVPSTEKGGRIHTSTVSVAVLPQPTEVELDIPDRDLIIETKRASGAGGQHVNTTDSAVRIVHVPTGTAVECQEGRSQIKNKQIALQKLRALLLQNQIEEQSSSIHKERKSQVGSGERNEKIRTYNFPQDRITDHRPGGSTLNNLKSFMETGEKLDELQESLLRRQTSQSLLEEIEEFKKNNSIET